MIVLGLHFEHDAGATLIKDGEIVISIEAERVTGIKHDQGLEAIRAATRAAFAQTGIRAEDVAAVGYADVWQSNYLPYRLDRRAEVQAATHGPLQAARVGSFDAAGFADLIPADIANLKPDIPVFVTCHSMNHAAAAVYMAGIATMAGLVIDGYGTCCGMMGYAYRDGMLARLERFCDQYLIGAGYHGIGVLARELAETEALDVAGKVMGLQAYGTPNPDWIKYFIEKYFLSSAATGYTDYLSREWTYQPEKTGRLCSELFPGGLPVASQTVQDVGYRNLVASAQEALTRIVTEVARDVVAETGTGDIFLSGGCALNIIANSAVAALPQVNSVFIPPNANDSGQAMGCAILVAHAMTDARLHQPKVAPERRRNPYIGARLVDNPEEAAVPEGVSRRRFDWDGVGELSLLARRMIAGEIMGLVNGASEIGPRALGNRSILALASFPGMKDLVNKIKRREWWRPFAPVCRHCDVDKYFISQQPSRYMLMNDIVREEWRGSLASITHCDGTARLQVLSSQEENPYLWKLLARLAEEGAIPIFLNTSFNLSQKPLVNSMQEVFDLLVDSEMRAVLVENWFFEKCA